MENMNNVVETVVENADELVKGTLKANRVGLYVIGGVAVVGATYYVGKKIHNKISEKKESKNVETDEPKANRVWFLNGKKHDDSEDIEDISDVENEDK
nr:MAG TPA: hypothetical protein [Caudoviricetes sp.]